MIPAESSSGKLYIQKVSLHNLNLFHFAAVNDAHEGVFTALLNCSKKVLNENEIKTLLQQNDVDQFNLFHFVARLNNEKSLVEIFTTLKIHLVKEEFKILLASTVIKGMNCLHLARICSSRTFIEVLCSIVEGFLEEDEIEEFFKACDSEGRSIFHAAVMNKEHEGVFTKLLNCVNKVLHEDEIKSIMKQSDIHGTNCSQLAISCDNKVVVAEQKIFFENITLEKKSVEIQNITRS